MVHKDQEAWRSFVTNQVSEIDSEQQAPYFTVEEELQYANRYEEGYDLFDAHYQAWLQVNHPEDANLASGLSSNPKELETPLPDRNSTDGTQSEGIRLCTTSGSMAEPSCDSSPTLATSTVAPVKRSPLSDLLNIPVANKPKKQVNTGRAHVLTSTQCLKALQEKENLKQQKTEDKA